MVEGAVLVGEAVAAGWVVEAQYVAPGVAPVAGAGPVRELATGVAERITATETPPGLFAIVHSRLASTEVLADAGLVVVADGVADPGNLGTILRSAEAAGVEAVVLPAGTVDPFNPKVVRASAGSLFHVPVVPAELADARQAGLAPARHVVAPRHARTSTSTGPAAWPSSSAARPTACPTTRRSTSGCGSPTPAAPRASTWRWPPPSSASPPPPPAADAESSTGGHPSVGGHRSVGGQRIRPSTLRWVSLTPCTTGVSGDFGAPGEPGAGCHCLTRRFPSPPGVTPKATPRKDSR